MSVTVSEVLDVISMTDGCTTFPVCNCEHPDDVWITWWTLMKRCQSPADVIHLKKILCCVLAGKGTYKVPDTSGGGGGTPSTPVDPTTNIPKYDDGMSKPPWSACTDWFTGNYCTTVRKTALKAALVAMQLYLSVNDPTDTSTDPKILMMKSACYIVQKILDLCDLDPATQGDKIAGTLKTICGVMDTIDPAADLPVIGYFFKNEHFAGFRVKCCGKGV
jgi:hypothetical protein